MAYNTDTENSIFYPRTFYALYIGPNNNSIGHLIFRLSTKHILITMKYEPIPLPNNLFKTISQKDSFTTKIQIDQFDSDRFIGQDDHFNDTKDDSQLQSRKVNNFEDKSHDEVDRPHQLDCMKFNTMIHQGNQIILIVGSSENTSISMINPNRITNTSTFLQGCFYSIYTKP